MKNLSTKEAIVINEKAAETIKANLQNNKQQIKKELKKYYPFFLSLQNDDTKDFEKTDNLCDEAKATATKIADLIMSDDITTCVEIAFNTLNDEHEEIIEVSSRYTYGSESCESTGIYGCFILLSIGKLHIGGLQLDFSIDESVLSMNIDITTGTVNLESGTYFTIR